MHSLPRSLMHSHPPSGGPPHAQHPPSGGPPHAQSSTLAGKKGVRSVVASHPKVLLYVMTFGEAGSKDLCGTPLRPFSCTIVQH
jgi:hypothetical protein